MDTNLTVAIVTNGSTALVGIVAVVVNTSWVRAAIESVDKNLSIRFERLESRLDKVETALEMLTGSMHDIDKRLSVMEDRTNR